MLAAWALTLGASPLDPSTCKSLQLAVCLWAVEVVLTSLWRCLRRIATEIWNWFIFARPSPFLPSTTPYAVLPFPFQLFLFSPSSPIFFVSFPGAGWPGVYGHLAGFCSSERRCLGFRFQNDFTNTGVRVHVQLAGDVRHNRLVRTGYQ